MFIFQTFLKQFNKYIFRFYYPAGHGRVLSRTDILRLCNGLPDVTHLNSCLRGILKLRILPNADLTMPVLPYRSKETGKLHFT